MRGGRPGMLAFTPCCQEALGLALQSLIVDGRDPLLCAVVILERASTRRTAPHFEDITHCDAMMLAGSC